MFTWIRNWYFGYKVCKKYGLKFKPNISLECQGVFFKSYYGTSFIEVSIRVQNFNTIFLHELGHFMDSRSKRVRGSFLKYGLPRGLLYLKLPNKSHCLGEVLIAEARASRFACRLGKSCGKAIDPCILYESLKSYVRLIPPFFNSLFKDNYDVEGILCKYISGK